MMRLFAALAIPEEQTEELLSLKAGIPGARWQRADQLHLTLKFIGDIEEPIARDVFATLDTLRSRRFEVQFAGAGVFGENRHAHTLWTGVANPVPLAGLHEKIDRALMGSGIPAERRRFHPHVTLARLKNPDGLRLQEFVADHQRFLSTPFTADAITLFRSHLGHSGAVYEALAEFPLE